MSQHAEKCPVCNGSGRYEEKTCHGCGGLGWVTVGTSTIPYVPYIPYIPYTPYSQPTWEPYTYCGSQIYTNVDVITN